MFSITLTSYYLNDCCLYFSHRISEVCAVLSRPCCAAKHPPERGSESRRARGHNTPKFSLSTKQGDFNLHSKFVFTSVLPHTCYIVVIAFFCFLSAAFEIISSVFRLRECRLEKIVQKRLLCQQVRRSIAPLVIFIKPKALLSRCPFNLMWRGFFLLSSSISSTQRDGAEQMDPTESPQHQTSAPVCYGQYVFIVCWHSVQVVCCAVHNHRVNS